LAKAPPPFVSIVVPFHNSAAKCRPLLDVLRLAPEDDVELILVDDGSTDGTPAILRNFAEAPGCKTTIVERPNGGPGAARNTGLERATGHYVWFVDSDDVIDLQAIEIARRARWDFDVIAWEYHHPHPGIACPISPGPHDTGNAPARPEEFETIVAKWFSRDFLRRTGLRFPENCVYEATPIEDFVLPFLVETYFKSNFEAYRVIIGQSVTRGGTDPRRFDRLKTIVIGMEFARRAKIDPELRERFDAAFVRLFLWYSLRLSTFPSGSWMSAARVMRQYRDEAKGFGISLDPFDLYRGKARSRIVMRLLWMLSFLLPSQRRHLKRLRAKAWSRELQWIPPEMPDRWRRA
jgi:glycosyltransferase involved in cell wall biosynthesis